MSSMHATKIVGTNVSGGENVRRWQPKIIWLASLNIVWSLGAHIDAFLRSFSAMWG